MFYFTKHLVTERKGRDKDAIPIEEEYLEALIKLFEYSGKKIEEREKKDDKKRKVHEQTRLSKMESLSLKLFTLNPITCPGILSNKSVRGGHIVSPPVSRELMDQLF